MSLPAELTWRRSRVQRVAGGDSQTYRRARLVIQGDQVRVFQGDGIMVAEATIEHGDAPSSRVLSLTTTTGEEWRAEQMGCNCGGGDG